MSQDLPKRKTGVLSLEAVSKIKFSKEKPLPEKSWLDQIQLYGLCKMANKLFRQMCNPVDVMVEVTQSDKMSEK